MTPIARRAVKLEMTGEDDRTFLISFGQTWRSKLREKYARQLVLSDGYALDQYRVWGAQHHVSRRQSVLAQQSAATITTMNTGVGV